MQRFNWNKLPVNRKMLPVLILFLAVALTYPLFWPGRMAMYSSVELFGLPELGMLSLLLTLPRIFKLSGTAGSVNDVSGEKMPAPAEKTETVYRRWAAIIPLLLLPAALADFGNLDFAFYCGMIFFGWFYHREVEKALPWFTVALAVVNMGIMVWEYVSCRPPYGLCGNWNWSMALLFAGCFAAPECFTVPKKGKLQVGFFLLGIFLWFYLGRGGYSSRGALLAASAAGAMIILSYLRNWKLKVLLPFILLPAVGGMLTYWIWRSSGELRKYLFSAGIKGGFDNWFTGAGTRHVSEAAAPYFTGEYFLSRFAADYHPHPHNEILYFFDASGIFGLLFFIGIMLVIYLAWLNYREKASPLLPAALMLLAYGMGDAGLAAWPLNAIFYLAVGTLFPAAEAGNFPAVCSPPGWTKRRKCWLWCGGGILLFLILYGAISNFYSGMCLRSARIGSGTLSLKEKKDLLDKSLAMKFSPLTAYLAGQCELFDFKNPAAADKYFALLEKRGYANYLHLNLLRGRSAAAQGDFEAAEKYFQAERRLYPLSINVLYYQELSRFSSGDKDGAAAVRAERLQVMKKRGIAPDKLPLLLKHPNWDISNDDRLFE